KNSYSIALSVYKFTSLLLCLLVIFLISCGSKKPKDNKLILLSPHNEYITKEFTTGFQKWFRDNYKSDVSLEWLDQGGTGNIKRYIESEFQKNPDGVNIDIFFGGGTDPHMDFKKAGFLYQYKLPDKILSKIPKDYAGSPVYDTDYYWYGACLAGFGIIYNKPQLSKMGLSIPQTWSDLAKPELNGWVSSGDLRQSGSVHKMYELILQVYGWEKGFDVITRMNANVKSFFRGSSEIPASVDLGETFCGLSIDINALARIAEAGSERLGYIMPEGETVINSDPIAILKGAPHKELAQIFVEFVMGEPGQKLWMLKKGEPEGPQEFSLRRMSVMPSMYDLLGDKIDVPTNPFKWKNTLAYDHEKGSARYGIIGDLIGSMTIDMHQDLKNAWKAVIGGGMKEEALKRLTAVPVSEDEAIQIGKEKWENQEFRNAKITEWTKFAQNKYKEAIKLSK
ncbi:extracellular solute-binding protein, partial [Candidatus Poribacteria bacterium]|nr:extracellular solute-binding protein [Candidatus Poribacteria bacterium]